jgi:hypothetical protein
MNNPYQTAKDMIARYRTKARAEEMAHMHMCDNMYDRSNPEMADYWRTVIREIRAIGVKEPD